MAANPMATEGHAARGPATKRPCPASPAGKTRPSVRRSPWSRQRPASASPATKVHPSLVVLKLVGLNLVALNLVVPEKDDTRRTRRTPAAAGSMAIAATYFLDA